MADNDLLSYFFVRLSDIAFKRGIVRKEIVTKARVNVVIHKIYSIARFGYHLMLSTHNE